jgi:hypothetical protein
VSIGRPPRVSGCEKVGERRFLGLAKAFHLESRWIGYVVRRGCAHVWRLPSQFSAERVLPVKDSCSMCLRQYATGPNRKLGGQARRDCCNASSSRQISIHEGATVCNRSPNTPDCTSTRSISRTNFIYNGELHSGRRRKSEQVAAFCLDWWRSCRRKLVPSGFICSGICRDEDDFFIVL